MARATGVIQTLAVGVVSSVLSVLPVATGPAQADIGGPVGGAVGGVVGGAVAPAAGSVTDPATHVTDPVTHVTDPVTHAAGQAVTNAVPAPVASAVAHPVHAVAHTVAHPVATVQKAARSTADQPRAASAPRQTAPHTSAQPGPKVTTANASHAAGTSRGAERSRHRAALRRASRVQPSGAPSPVRAQAAAYALMLASAPTAARRQAVGASEASADQACRSASLNPGDLLRCARVDMLLPSLGGPRAVLLPVSLALVGLGLAMVVRGRRRHEPSVADAI